jgi:hypothetical protein
MKYLIFIILLFCSMGYSQPNFSDDFSNFVRIPDDSVKGYWVLDNTYQNDVRFGAPITDDLSANNNDLTASGFSANFADETTSGGILYQGGTYLTTDGASELLEIVSADAADFNVDTSFSITAFVALTGTLIKNWYVKSGGDYYSSRSTSGGVFQSRIHDGTTTIGHVTGAINDNVFRHVAVVYDFENNQLAVYLNGVLNGTPGNLTLDPANIDVSSADFEIFNISGKAQALMWWHKALTAKEIKEEAFLATRWDSENGGVTRDNWAFNQGIMTDTIRHAIKPGNGTGYFDAWGAAGGEILKVSNKAGDDISYDLTVDSTRYVINFIQFSVNDSIYFSTTGTVYIDNVYIEPVNADLYAYE